jgi:hypothetical protein
MRRPPDVIISRPEAPAAGSASPERKHIGALALGQLEEGGDVIEPVLRPVREPDRGE